MKGLSMAIKNKHANLKQVAIVMGSDSDWDFMKAAPEFLDRVLVGYQVAILSAHRCPVETADFAKGLREAGFRVAIAGAGGSAHLPGVIASYCDLPVIGVPIPLGPLQGQDSLYSIVQMPKGVPVATVGIGNAWNAAVLAVQILASGLPSGSDQNQLRNRLLQYRDDMRLQVLKKSAKLAEL